MSPINDPESAESVRIVKAKAEEAQELNRQAAEVLDRLLRLVNELEERLNNGV